MRDRKGCRLLRERQWKFPDQNDGRVHKDGERAVLEFAGEIAADPGVRTQEGPVAFGPTARYIGEHRQDRYFIIIVPKNERIVPEENETECDNAQAGSERTEKIWPPINTDFHRCSNGEKPSPSSSPHSGERAGGRIVSPDLCSSVAKYLSSKNDRLTLGHHEDFVLDAMSAGGRQQSLRRLVEWLKAEAKCSVMHRNQCLGAKFQERLDRFFRIHVDFTAGRRL